MKRTNLGSKHGQTLALAHGTRLGLGLTCAKHVYVTARPRASNPTRRRLWARGLATHRAHGGGSYSVIGGTGVVVVGGGGSSTTMPAVTT